LAGTNQAPDRRGGFFGFVIAAMLFLIVRQLRGNINHAAAADAEKKKRLDAGVNNMWQGLLLSTQSERMVICNQR